MTDDTYEGWKNRETWALQLWLTNDQGLYEMTRERVQEAVETYRKGYEPGDGLQLNDVLPVLAGEAVKDFVDELTDPDESLMTVENIVKLLADVGSLYRVDWDAIGAAWLADVTEND